MTSPRIFKGFRTLLRYAAVLLVLCTVLSAVLSVPNVGAVEKTTAGELDDLQEKYDDLEKKISKSEQNLKTIEAGKAEQKKNISALDAQIKSLDSQIDVLEKRIDILDSDIRRLNVSINTLNTEINKLDGQIDETEALIRETQRSINLISDKIYARLLISYMSGSATKLELLVGSKDLYTLFTKLQIISNISSYDSALVEDFSLQLERLDELNAKLDTDVAELKQKRAKLTGEQDTLYSRQADIESSAYVLEMKKQLSQYKYSEAVAYFKTLDKSSADYAAMLRLFSDEQQKIDDEMNAYLLKYGSSADSAEATATTAAATDATASPEGESSTGATTKKVTTTTFTTVKYSPQTLKPYYSTNPATTTATTSIDDIELTIPTTSGSFVSTGTDLIWPMPYKNCYISAYYGTYPLGGIHRGIDICVRGGTEGKNVVAAGSGRVIRHGFNHWSMGNYVIIDHGAGLFTAYYHLKTLYVEEGDTVAQGKIIGLAGSTGNSTGPHLHFEVRTSRNGVVAHTDPLKWVKNA